jgi:hypothetical protein
MVSKKHLTANNIGQKNTHFNYLSYRVSNVQCPMLELSRKRFLANNLLADTNLQPLVEGADLQAELQQLFERPAYPNRDHEGL